MTSDPVRLTGYGLLTLIRRVVNLGASLLIGLLFGVHMGLFMWGGLWLRSSDLRSVFPLRKMAA